MISTSCSEQHEVKYGESNSDNCEMHSSELSCQEEIARTRTSQEQLAAGHQCSVTLTNSSSLNTHNRTNTDEKPIACPNCIMTFAQSNDLQRHIQTGDKPYACQHCSRRFTVLSSLRRHNRTHTGDKLYACPHCSKKLTVLSNLMAHSRTHTGEKPFACPYCNMSFAQSGNLKAHIRTHTGEKPFACPHCSKRFAQSGGLKRHIYTHTHTGETPSVCPQFSMRFERSGNLSRRVLTHTGEKPYGCPHCSQRFTRLESPPLHCCHVHSNRSDTHTCTQSNSDFAISDINTNRQCVEQSLSDLHQDIAESSSFTDVARFHCDEDPLSEQDCYDSMNNERPTSDSALHSGIFWRFVL